MADKKIEEATRVASVDGSEILPASVGGAAKSLTTEQVKAYVLSAIAALADAEDWGSDSGDRVTVKQNGANKHVTVGDLVDTVFASLTGKEAAATLADGDVISIKNSSSAKTTTLGAIKSYISTAFTGNMDIHGLTAADNAGAADELAAYQAGEVNANRKVTVAQVAAAVAPTVATAATISQTAIGSTDCIIISREATGGTSTLEKVPLQSSGLSATSSVSGPNTTTVDKIPQWSSTTRGLKDGLSLVDGIGSSSTDSEIPTAKAAYNCAHAEASGKVSGPASVTNGDIAIFNGTSGKSISGGVSMVSTIRAAASAEDTKVPTEKAVASAIEYGSVVRATNTPYAGAIAYFPTAGSKTVDAQGLTKATSISGVAIASDDKLATELAVAKAVANATDDKVSGPALSTNGDIVRFDGTTGKEVKGGLSLATSVRAAASAEDTKVPTEKAVATALVGKISPPALVTDGNIPQWDGTNGAVKNGLGVATSISSYGTASDSNVPTERAVSEKLQNVIRSSAGPNDEGKIAIFATGQGEKLIAPRYSVENSSAAISVETSIPTCKAVFNSMANTVIYPGSNTTVGKIPQWSSTNHNLADGLTPITTILDTSTNSEIPTAKSVYTLYRNSTVTGSSLSMEDDGNIPVIHMQQDGRAELYTSLEIDSSGSGGNDSIPKTSAVIARINNAKSRVDIVSYAPADGATGYNRGVVVLVNTNSIKKLYLNIGSTEGAVWLKFSADAS